MRLINLTIEVQYPTKTIFCDNFLQHFLTVCDINGIYEFVNHIYVSTEDGSMTSHIWNLRL